MTRGELTDRVRALAGAARRRHDRAALVQVDAGPPDEDALAMLARARALGAPDPYRLLEQGEASRLLGVRLGPPQLVYADALIGVRCAAVGRSGGRWAAEVAVLHGDEDGFDAEAAWAAQVARAGAGAVAVGGLGDGAWLAGNAVHLRAGDTVAVVRVAAPAPAPAAAHALVLARRVAARL